MMPARHCEEQGDEAIRARRRLDCFALLAMTIYYMSPVTAARSRGARCLSDSCRPNWGWQGTVREVPMT